MLTRKEWDRVGPSILDWQLRRLKADIARSSSEHRAMLQEIADDLQAEIVDKCQKLLTKGATHVCKGVEDRYGECHAPSTAGPGATPAFPG